MSDSGPADASICVGCGLCCDGTLFATATVRPEDTGAVTALGLQITQGEGKQSFHQPCPLFSCGGCSAYDRRPDVCRGYRCALLMRVEAREVSPSLAREKIEQALELRAAVREVDATAITPTQRTALTERLRGELRGQNGEAAKHSLLSIASFEHFLNRWFLEEHEGVARSDNR